MRALALAVLVAAAVTSASAVAAPKVMPGQWQSVVTVQSMSMPGVPPAALAQMKQKPTTISYCLTPQEAEADPRKIMGADKSCKVTRFSFEGGKFSSAMTCQTDRGPSTITSTGTYTPTSYAMATAMKSAGMTMASRVTAKRLGPCK